MSEAVIHWGGGDFLTNGDEIIPVFEGSDETRGEWVDAEIRDLAEELLDKGIIFDTEIEEFVAAAKVVGMFDDEAAEQFMHAQALEDQLSTYEYPQEPIPGL